MKDLQERSEQAAVSKTTSATREIEGLALLVINQLYAQQTGSETP
jgi:hypothetical protein